MAKNVKIWKDSQALYSDDTITKWVKSAKRIHNLSPQLPNVTAHVN